MSNFKNVWVLNEVFKKPTTSALSQEGVDYDVIESQLALIEEEFTELVNAVQKRDWEGVKDAIGDVLVTAYGMGYAGQFDCDQLMANIHASNMSKVCRTKLEADRTVTYYRLLGVDVTVSSSHIIEPFLYFFKRKVPVLIVKSAKQQTYVEDGTSKTIKAGKFLKNVAWFEPSLAVDIAQQNS